MKPVVTLAVCAAILASAGSTTAFAVTTGQAKAAKTQTEITGLAPISLSDSYIPEQTTSLTKGQTDRPGPEQRRKRRNE